jgi:putative PIN family toxin of toxin-antitoxin system
VARAVLDPNVLVSALISPSGPSAELLAELRLGAFELVTSPLLLAELEGVLRREKFRRYITEAEVDAFVDLIRRESVLLDDPEPSSTPLSEDPGDEYLIALARAARTDALVSGDPHVLRLRRSIPARTPREFLNELRAGGR